MEHDFGTMALEALRLVDDDPTQAWRLARTVVAEAQAASDFAAAAVAERAWGLAALHLTSLDTSVRHLQAALASATRARSPRLTGEARMSLAFALNRRGDVRAALRQVNAALEVLDGLERARALGQRAAILQQLGRLEEALAGYRSALPALREAGDWVWVQRVHSNRGLIWTHRADFTAAEADLAEAERICRREGLDMNLAFVLENIGFVKTRRGDVPAALNHFDDAERRYGQLGAPIGSLLEDRSELLLTAHLVPEAREAAEGAVAEFTQLHRRIHLPEAQLLLAAAALLDGDADSALVAAEQAARAFARQRRTEWLALARFTTLRCQLAGAAVTPVTPGRLIHSADALAATGWAVSAADARLLAARALLDRGRVAQAQDQLRLVARTRRRGPAELRARAWHAEALLRLVAGRRRAASSALTAGLRVLEEHHAILGATDLRAHASAQRGDLVTLGLRLALERRQPRPVLQWAERGRAVALLARPVRPPDDPVLADALGELRSTVAGVLAARGSGQPDDALVRHQVSLEHTIRDYVRRAHTGTDGSSLRPALSGLGAALGEAALVEYLELDEGLYAVTLVDHRARLHRLGAVDEVRTALDHIPFALRRLARHGGGTGTGPALTLLRQLGARLDDQLLRPLAGVVGDRALVLVPTGPLQCLPWSLLPTCAGRPVTVSPSAALWQRAHASPPPAAELDGHVVVAAGPDLPAAPAEARAVAQLYPEATLLVDGAATADAVKGALAGGTVAHIAAHGHFRTDNPLFSSLRLADGPLTVYDLESVPEAPRLVVLAACDSAQSAICTGDELLGLSATFLTLGTSALVGCTVPVPDAAAAPLMVGLHRLVRSGMPPAAALAQVQQEVGDDPGALAASLGFVCFGDGHALVPLPAPSAPVPAQQGSRTVDVRGPRVPHHLAAARGDAARGDESQGT